MDQKTQAGYVRDFAKRSSIDAHERVRKDESIE